MCEKEENKIKKKLIEKRKMQLKKIANYFLPSFFLTSGESELLVCFILAFFFFLIFYRRHFKIIFFLFFFFNSAHCFSFKKQKWKDPVTQIEILELIRHLTPFA